MNIYNSVGTKKYAARKFGKYLLLLFSSAATIVIMPIINPYIIYPRIKPIPLKLYLGAKSKIPVHINSGMNPIIIPGKDKCDLNLFIVLNLLISTSF